MVTKSPFQSLPRGFWKSEENRRAYFDWVAEERVFESLDDWYSVSQKELRKHEHAIAVLAYHSSSLPRAVTELYPSHQWHPWKFTKAPRGFWQDGESRRMYLDWLGTELGFTDYEDWYRITADDFRDNHGRSLLAFPPSGYGGDVSGIVTDNFPEYDWKLWLFNKTPRGFADSRESRTEMMDWLGSELGFERPEDWYEITKEDFQGNLAGLLSHHYSNTPSAAVMEAYPETDWIPWLFHQTPGGFWLDEGNRWEYLRWFEEQMGITDPSDWYSITSDDFKSHNGITILYNVFSGSTRDVAKHLYPDYPWIEWMFRKVPDGFWEDLSNVRDFLDWLATELGIEDPEQWYVYTNKVLEKHGGGYIANNLGLSRSLKAAYPEYEWNEARLLKIGKTELQLYKIIQELFPDDDVIHRYKHPELRFSESGRPMELDVWVPSQMLAFEYQGEQHSMQRWGQSAEDLDNQIQRDEQKREACKEAEIRLIEVDYTWDREKESVVRKIEQTNPKTREA